MYLNIRYFFNINKLVFFMCGIFAIYSKNKNIAKQIFFALYSLQHRGQECAGISTFDGTNTHIHKDMGLVSQIFNEENIQHLKGHIGIGHVRYPTEGLLTHSNIQPATINTISGPIIMAHNGSLVHYDKIKNILLEKGIGNFTSSDAETICQLLSVNNNKNWIEKIKDFMKLTQGAFSITLIANNTLYAFRDMYGIRPLVLGKLDDGSIVVSSESCAFHTIGAKLIRDVEAGEILKINSEGYESFSVFDDIDKVKTANCIFENIYFSRPDSIINNYHIHKIRQNIGKQLAILHPVNNADVVIGVPDSALAHAIGYAKELGVTYNEGLAKNRYIQRTFIHPDDDSRRTMVKLKYNMLGCNLKDKVVVLIDDSIVRGFTIGPIVELLKNGGAKEIHVRIASPPIKHPCYMGINMKNRDEMVANQMTIEEMEKRYEVKSLRYIDIEHLMKAMPSDDNHCTACFTGDYPIDIEDL